jgi:sodium/bile acid cotransporter 3/5
MMPFWIFILGKEIITINNAKVNIPYANLAFSLIGMTIPLAIGILIQKRKPNWAEKSKKIIRPFTIILLIIAIGGGLYVNYHLLKLFTWSIMAAGMCVAWGGYIFGALAAFLAKLTPPQIIAVSIETALQNPGIAFVLLQLSLPQPESDLAAIPLIGQLLMTGPPLWIVYLVFIIIRKIKNKDKDKDKDKDEVIRDENSEVTKEMLPSV